MANAPTQLIRQAQAGDPGAFGELVERYAPLVSSVLLDMVRRGEVAEDLAQETFCQAWRALPGLREPEGFAAWLAQIARRRGLDWLRSEAARSRAEAGLRDAIEAEPPQLPEDPVARGEEHTALWAALTDLDEADRRVLLLRHVEGCSYRQIAGFLDLSTAGVFQRLRRAERHLGREVTRRLRGTSSSTARRRALRTAVLAALALPGASRAGTAPAVPISGGPPQMFPWLDVAWKSATVGLVLSLAAHMAGLLGPGLFGDEAGEGGDSLRVEALGQGFASARLAATPPTALAPQGSPHATADPITAPAVDSLAAPVPPRVVERRPALPVILDDGASRAEDNSEAPGSPTRAPALAPREAEESLPPRDSGPPRIHGAEPVLHLRPVRLLGAGTYPTLFLADLARFLRDHLGMDVEVDGPVREGFRDPRLLDNRLHFLLQGEGEPPATATAGLQLSPDESALLRRYLALGGFLYLEGDRLFLQSALDSLSRLVPASAKVRLLEPGDALLSAAYHLPGGFPGERGTRTGNDIGWDWVLPLEAGLPLGARGIEIDGRLQVLLCAAHMFRDWQPNRAIAEGDSVVTPPKTPYLRAAANIVTYALAGAHPQRP